ncbi:MAG: hypothetical protein ACK5M7_20245 [Draconibacterium sp.]
MNLTPQIDIPTLNAESIGNVISSNFLLIIFLIIGVIISAIVCYLACSYLVMLWNHFLGIKDFQENTDNDYHLA